MLCSSAGPGPEVKRSFQSAFAFLIISHPALDIIVVMLASERASNASQTVQLSKLSTFHFTNLMVVVS